MNQGHHCESTPKTPTNCVSSSQLTGNQTATSPCASDSATSQDSVRIWLGSSENWPSLAMRPTNTPDAQHQISPAIHASRRIAAVFEDSWRGDFDLMGEAHYQRNAHFGRRYVPPPSMDVSSKNASDIAQHYYEHQLEFNSAHQELASLPAKRWPERHPKNLRYCHNLEKQPERVRALLMQIAGENAAIPCDRCQRGGGPFTECVKIPGHYRDICANCTWGGNSPGCSFE